MVLPLVWCALQAPGAVRLVLNDDHETFERLNRKHDASKQVDQPFRRRYACRVVAKSLGELAGLAGSQVLLTEDA
tara:strand:- start:1151 stop:1375 length:225 start_codon:yes stop_codon:yes gene_type:complete